MDDDIAMHFENFYRTGTDGMQRTAKTSSPRCNQ